MTQFLTHSRMSTFRACQRRHYLRYELKLSAEEKSFALRVGSAFHEVLDAWSKDREPKIEGIDPYDLAVVSAMVQTHHEVQPELDVVESEAPFLLPLRNRATGRPSPLWRWPGMIDSIVRTDSGHLALLERKTTTRDITPGSDYWLQVQRDQQVSQYVMAARALGWDIRTVLYDVVRRPLHRPYRATPEDERKYKQPDVQFGKLAKEPLTGGQSFTITVNGQHAGHAHKGKHGEWYVDELHLDVLPVEVDMAFGTLASKAKPAIRKIIGKHVTGPLYAGQRLEDETPVEYAARMAEAMRAEPDKYFIRVEIPRLQSELDAAADDQWAVQQLIRRAQLAGVWPRNPAACVTPFRCSFLDICDGDHTPSTPVPIGFRRLATPHPELSPEAGGTSR